jgi:threonine dehydrogenase-like Zn-dependent dehydrogenase
MKALAWHGKGDIRCDTVPDPRIQDGRDAIIKVTACAICGSDLHLFDGIMPTMEKADVLGHETMGEVVEVGPDNKAIKVGDRVVVPFTISCGECFFCKRGFYSGCERSNPNAKMAAKLWGHSPAGLFGYSHLLGGFAGGQAEYMRVPFADAGPIKVPQGLSDEQVLFLSDIFPTGYMAAEFCDLKGGETVAVWGCGPVGQFAIKSAFLLGAERVIAIDTVPERLELAEASGALTLDFLKEDTYDRIQELTQGRGADACIDAVGTEPETSGFDAVLDRIKVATFMGTRSAACSSPSHSLLPQLRHGFDRRRLRRLPRQDPDGFGDQSRPHVPHGADAGPALFAEAAGAHREGRNRSFLRHHSSGFPGARARTLQDLPRQERRLHQGGHETVTMPWPAF